VRPSNRIQVRPISRSTWRPSERGPRVRDHAKAAQQIRWQSRIRGSRVHESLDGFVALAGGIADFDAHAEGAYRVEPMRPTRPHSQRLRVDTLSNGVRS